MLTKRHIIFNLIIIIIPWVSLLLVGKRNFKRYAIASILIVVVDIIDHVIGKNRKWWCFYSPSKSFFTNELPIIIGLYMPVSIWVLTLYFGDFKKYVKLNAVGDAIFAFGLMKLFKKLKIARLDKLNSIQFFLFIHAKAYLLYFVQYIVENISYWIYKVVSLR